MAGREMKVGKKKELMHEEKTWSQSNSPKRITGTTSTIIV
jgi:hypothetical protein